MPFEHKTQASYEDSNWELCRRIRSPLRRKRSNGVPVSIDKKSSVLHGLYGEYRCSRSIGISCSLNPPYPCEQALPAQLVLVHIATLDLCAHYQTGEISCPGSSRMISELDAGSARTCSFFNFLDEYTT